MTMTGDPIYAMGRSEGERRRLVEQAAIYAASTRHLFAEAGIRPGMRVLDAGCGVGDVSLLAAAIVGSGGRVVGVDTDVQALAVARARATQAGLDQVQFVLDDVRQLPVEQPFDAVVGRFVLMYLTDPTDGLRRLCRHLAPGGVVAFQEFQFEGLMRVHPEAPGSLYARAADWVLETFRRAGVETNMGFRLAKTFREAGLPAPQATLEAPLASGPDHAAYRLFAHVLESMLPLIEGFGVATADEIGVATFARRLSDQAVAEDAVGCCPPVVGAWARLEQTSTTSENGAP